MFVWLGQSQRFWQNFAVARGFILGLLGLAMILFAGFVKAEEPPAGLSGAKLQAWEVEHLITETVKIRETQDKIFVNNHYCPLQRRIIREPIDFLSRDFVYKGKNPKFKNKTFVFNFCCGVCRKRFHEHFAKFPDLILEKYEIR